MKCTRTYKVSIRREGHGAPIITKHYWLLLEVSEKRVRQDGTSLEDIVPLPTVLNFIFGEQAGHTDADGISIQLSNGFSLIPDLPTWSSEDGITVRAIHSTCSSSW